MNYKKEKGITLVALVVTIVVLLILAGVSINLVLGENGLITQAKTAKAKTAEMTNDENYLVNSYVPDYIAEQVNGTTENKTSDTVEEPKDVIKIGNTIEYVYRGKNIAYEKFLAERISGITYTVEFVNKNPDWSVWLDEDALIIYYAPNGSSEYPDSEILVKASNGEEKTVTVTGGEME